jgi:hypothetical protein
MRRDLDDILRSWPYEPGAGCVQAREVRARDGRTVLQIRVELGVLQLEPDGRPDGTRPHGFKTYLDYLRHEAAGRGQAEGGKAPRWTMAPEHCVAAEHELTQFHQRRLAWVAVPRFDKVLLDADHTLALMDFLRRHGPDGGYLAAHERMRGLVLFHRAHAAAVLALERRRPEEAIDEIHEGAERLIDHQREWASEHDLPEPLDEPLIEQLGALEREIRKSFAVQQTLREQLAEAVAREDYERASLLRDQIRARVRR